ncbi:MAG: Ig-like domain-containing protein [Candidatus ainarchaeum sp.]|nr:Ig-like domain-containing protein [Candidatus ainarchaeum sp.]
MDKKFFIILILIGIIFFSGNVLAEPSITINGGETHTNDNDVIARILNTEDINYCVTLSDNNNNCEWILSELDDINIDITLTGDDGGKEVFLHTKNNLVYDTKSDTIILDTTGPVITVNGVTDENYYDNNVFAITIEAVDANVGKYNGKITYSLNESDKNIYSSQIDWTLEEGNYVLVVDANDDLGNISTKTISFIVDITEPLLLGVLNDYSGIGSYTNSVMPTFTISLEEDNPDKIFFSCSNGSNWFERNYNSTINDFNIVSSSYDCNNDDGTKTIYVKINDKFGNTAGPVTTTINYDGTSPAPPTGLSVSNGNKEVTVSWNAPTADNLSGNKEYEVYKNGDLYATTTSTSKTVTGLTNGTNYSFKIKTIDNAGNKSSFSSTISGTPQSCSCELTIKRSGTSVEYVKGGDNLLISCNWEEEVDDAKIRYRYYDGSWESLQNLSSEEDNTDFIEENISINGNNERIEFQCIASNVETKTKTIYIDNELPTIQWNVIDSTLKETREISANITDNKNIKSVEFELNSVKHNPTKSGNKYYFNLDTTKIANGTYSLKVSAIDEAGNQSQKTTTITIENLLTEEQKRIKAINDAKTKKVIVDDLIKYYEERGLKLSEEMLGEKQRADDLLEEAEETDNNTVSKTKAEEAKSIYDNINEKIVFENVESKNYEYEKENLTLLLSGIGLIGEQLEQAKNNILEGNVERKITIIKIGEEYRAQIELSFELGEEDYIIVEVIPKEFVENASKIFSNTDFNIIEDDPVIEFLITKDIKKIFYSIDVKEEDANTLMDNNVIDLFASPPIILKANEKISIVKENGMFFIILIIIILIIILICGIGFFVLKNNKNDFGKNNPIGKMKEKLLKPEEKKKDWKYKG